MKMHFYTKLKKKSMLVSFTYFDLNVSIKLEDLRYFCCTVSDGDNIDIFSC